MTGIVRVILWKRIKIGLENASGYHHYSTRRLLTIYRPNPEARSRFNILKLASLMLRPQHHSRLFYGVYMAWDWLCACE